VDFINGALVQVDQLLYYFGFLVDFAAAIPFFMAASRLQLRHAASRFRYAGGALIARAVIPIFVRMYFEISTHIGSRLIDDFFSVTLDQRLPSYLVLAAALFAGSGVTEIVTPPRMQRRS